MPENSSTNVRRRHRPVNSSTQSSGEILLAIRGSRVAIFSQDTDLRYRWVENLPDGLGPAGTGATEADIFPEPAASVVLDQKRKVLTSGESHTFELPVLLNGITRIFEIFVHPEFDQLGLVAGVTGSAVDVSRERRQAQSMAKLILEVSHRSRNMLAIVQSIAAQTAMQESSVEVYRDRFVGRLQSLSRTQDIITALDWMGARAGELVEAQIEGIANRRRMSVDCAAIYLTPASALHVGLAIHELAANVMDGSEVAKDQAIAIRITETGQEEMPVRLTWTESHGAKASRFSAFAKSVLERAAPQAVDGRAVLTEGAERTEYVLHIGATAVQDTTI